MCRHASAAGADSERWAGEARGAAQARASAAAERDSAVAEAQAASAGATLPWNALVLAVLTRAKTVLMQGLKHQCPDLSLLAAHASNSVCVAQRLVLLGKSMRTWEK